MSCNPVNSLRQYASKAYFMGERYLIQSRYTGIESVLMKRPEYIRCVSVNILGTVSINVLGETCVDEKAREYHER